MKPTKEEMFTWIEVVHSGTHRPPFPACRKGTKCWQLYQAVRQLIENQPEVDKPKIICLCGSTRFTDQMLIKQWELTKRGFIVLTWCALPESYFSGEDKAHIGDQEEVKEIVDEVHKRKIDLADEVFILNVGGYIGESTRNELEYAQKGGKKIRFLEPEKAGVRIKEEKL